MPNFRPGLLALLLALPAPLALAQDDPAPESDTKSAPAEVGREVSEQALAKLKGWGKAMHLPSQTTADVIEATASARHTTMFEGGALNVAAKWSRQDGVSLDVTLPPEMTDVMAPQVLAMVEGSFKMWAREALAPVFESPVQYAKDYHVGDRKEGEREVVELLPCTELAATERQVLHFDEAGLCERRIFVLRVDPNDPSQQMMIGAEIEASFSYAKVGERHVLERMELLLPFGDIQVDYTYYEITNGPPLLRSLSMMTPFGPDPVEVSIADYTMDGNAIAETKKAEEAPAKEPETPETPDEAGGGEQE